MEEPPNFFRNKEENKKFERLVKIATSKQDIDLKEFLLRKRIIINKKKIGNE